jgi:hypothetical protein
MASNLDFTSALEIKLDIQALPMCVNGIGPTCSEGWIYKEFVGERMIPASTMTE